MNLHKLTNTKTAQFLGDLIGALSLFVTPYIFLVIAHGLGL